MTDEITQAASGVAYTPTDLAAIDAAKAAGVASPATISDTATAPSVGELHMRVQALESLKDRGDDVFQRLTALEAMIAHVFETYFRTANVPEIIDSWVARMAIGASEVLDANAKRGY